MRFRVGSVLAGAGLLLAFLLSVYLKDPTPFTVVAPVAIGGKWIESTMQRAREPKREAA